MTETTVSYVYETTIGTTLRKDTVNDANPDATPEDIVNVGDAIASLVGGSHKIVYKKVTTSYPITDE